MANTRQTVFKVLLKMYRDKSYSNLLLNSYFQDSDFLPRDKAFISVLVYGVTERLMTIDYNIEKHLKQPLKKLKPEVLIILRIGTYQLLFMDSVPQSAAINESVNLTKKNGCSFASGLVNAVLRGISKDGLMLPDENDSDYLSIKYSCPNWLIDLWTQSYGFENAVEILESSIGDVPIYIRANTLKTNTNELIEKFSKDDIKATKVSLLEDAIKLEKPGNIENNQAFIDGLFHVQDLSSQLCCLALDAKPNESILDVCSAPGGKSFTIAERMKNQGIIDSCDIYDFKLKLIDETALRLGIKIINTKLLDASVFNQNHSQYDKILCDVPCSGLGIIRRKPEIRYKLSENIDKLQDLQYSIMCVSARYLKKGGRMVYSTCSLNPKENTDVVEKFLSEHSNFHIVDIFDENYGIKKSSTLTLLPHIHDTDGFFIAVLEKDC